MVHKCTSKNENYGTSLHLSLFKKAKILRFFLFILKGRGTIGVWDGGRGQLPPSFEKSTIFRAAAAFFGQRSQNEECLNATCKAWEVPFPAIWEVFLAKNFLLRYAPTDGGAPLR